MMIARHNDVIGSTVCDVMVGKSFELWINLVDGTRHGVTPIGRHEVETIGSRRWLAGLQSNNTFYQPPSTLHHQRCDC
jgi:hypothetical protein